MDFSIGTAAVLVDPPDAAVWMRGELDFATAPAMAAQLDGAVAAGCREFRVDLAEVSFCDASTVRLLLGLERQLREVGGSLSIVEPARCVRRVFELVGLGDMLDGATEPAL
ncbi:STAS domain-containing protein [Nocardioides pyridinolyticus]